MAQIRAATALVAAGLALGGCATPYQPRGATGGYLDKKIDDNTYLVSFYGNGNTSRDSVFRMWLYRCADLTNQHGYDYFVVLGNPRRSSRDGSDGVATVAAATGREDVLPMRSGGGAPTYYYVPGGTYSIARWSARAAIRMHKGEPPKDRPRTFLAREVLADLGPEVIEGQSASGATAKYRPDIVFGAGASSMNTSAPPNPGGVPSATEMDDLKELLPGGQ